MKKLTKLQIALIPILLMISPIVILAVIGIVYVGIMMIIGNSLAAGYDAFINLINTLKPYFGYLTVIPMAAVVIGVAVKFAKKKSDNEQES